MEDYFDFGYADPSRPFTADYAKRLVVSRNVKSHVDFKILLFG